MLKSRKAAIKPHSDTSSTINDSITGEINEVKVHSSWAINSSSFSKNKAKSALYTFIALLCFIASISAIREYKKEMDLKLSLAFTLSRIKNTKRQKKALKRKEFSKIFSQKKPRIVQLFSASKTKKKKKREIYISSRQKKKYKKIAEDDEYYEENRHDQFEEGNCKKQYEWQVSSYPSCNIVHEINMKQSKLLTDGYWRDVWRIRILKKYHVFKTLRYEHDYTLRNAERHRRDAVAMERLSSSKYILDIYAFCGHASIVTYSTEGDIDYLVFESSKNQYDTLDPKIKLKVAIQVARGVATVHTFPHDLDTNSSSKALIPSIAHTDITPSQFIYVNGIYKLNDFNRCRFIRYDAVKKQQCEYYVGNNPNKFRSPEEYSYEEQSEKVDVYSMANIFYVLLTQKWPFQDVKDRIAKRSVRKGKPPVIDSYILNSTDVYTQLLINATYMGWTFDPKKRPTAKYIQEYLTTSFHKVNRITSSNEKNH